MHRGHLWSSRTAATTLPVGPVAWSRDASWPSMVAVGVDDTAQDHSGGIYPELWHAHDLDNKGPQGRGAARLSQDVVAHDTGSLFAFVREARIATVAFCPASPRTSMEDGGDR